MTSLVKLYLCYKSVSDILQLGQQGLHQASCIKTLGSVLYYFL